MTTYAPSFSLLRRGFLACVSPRSRLEWKITPRLRLLWTQLGINEVAPQSFPASESEMFHHPARRGCSFPPAPRVVCRWMMPRNPDSRRFRRNRHNVLWGCGFALGIACQPTPPPEVAGSPEASGCGSYEMALAPEQVLEGKATYYGDSLAGNKTASGEVYDPGRLTAAHRTLPFGTRVLVQRSDVPARAVCVTITDRGPFAGPERIIDLSRRAAEHLEMIRAGVVPVRVYVLPSSR